MSNRKNIKNNFVFSLLSQIVMIAIGLLIPRLIMIGYGSDINGLLSSVAQFVVYLSLFESGIQQVALKSLYEPVCRDSKERINSILSAVNIDYKKVGIYYLCGLVLLSIIYPLFVTIDGLSYSSVFLILFFSGFGNVIFFFAQGKYKIFLQASGKTYILSNIQTVISVLTNFSKIILLYCGFDVVVVIFFTFCISLIQCIYIMIYIKKNYKWIDVSVTPDKGALKHKNVMLIHQIAGLVFQNTDVLILTILCDLKVVSVYSVYKLVMTHIASLLQIIFNSFSYRLGQLFNTDKSEFIKMIDAVEILCGMIGFSIFSVTACLIIPFVELYTLSVTDIKYTSYIIAYLFILIELLTFMRIPMLNTINYAGKFKETLPQTITETIINIVVSVVAVKFIGITGVLIGTIFALIYRNIDIIIYSNKNLLGRSSIKTFLIYVINMSILLAFVIIWRIINVNITSWLWFCIYGFIFTGISLPIFTFMNCIAHKNEYLYLKNKIVGTIIKRR